MGYLAAPGGSSGDLLRAFLNLGFGGLGLKGLGLGVLGFLGFRAWVQGLGLEVLTYVGFSR